MGTGQITHKRRFLNYVHGDRNFIAEVLPVIDGVIIFGKNQDNETSSRQIFAAKLSSNLVPEKGNTSRFDGQGHECPYSALKIDGGFIVTGYSTSVLSLHNVPDFNALVVKYDEYRNVEFVVQFYGDGVYTYGRRTIQDSGGSFVTIFRYGVMDPKIVPCIGVIKYNVSDGKPRIFRFEWKRIFCGEFDVDPYSIIETKTGYLIGGRFGYGTYIVNVDYQGSFRSGFSKEDSSSISQCDIAMRNNSKEGQTLILDDTYYNSTYMIRITKLNEDNKKSCHFGDFSHLLSKQAEITADFFEGVLLSLLILRSALFCWVACGRVSLRASHTC